MKGLRTFHSERRAISSLTASTDYSLQNHLIRQKMPIMLNSPSVKQNLPTALHLGLLSIEPSNVYLISF
jgi:hypothetical protein